MIEGTFAFALYKQTPTFLPFSFVGTLVYVFNIRCLLVALTLIVMHSEIQERKSGYRPHYLPVCMRHGLGQILTK